MCVNGLILRRLFIEENALALVKSAVATLGKSDNASKRRRNVLRNITNVVIFREFEYRHDTM